MKDRGSQSGDEIHRGMIIKTRTFNENHHIRLFKAYLWLKYQCISSKNSSRQNERLLPHFQPDGLSLQYNCMLHKELFRTVILCLNAPAGPYCPGPYTA